MMFEVSSSKQDVMFTRADEDCVETSDHGCDEADCRPQTEQEWMHEWAGRLIKFHVNIHPESNQNQKTERVMRM